MARTPRSQRIITGFLIISGLLAFLYVSVSISLALIITYRPPKPITTTPSSLGLNYRDVTFLSREDHLTPQRLAHSRYIARWALDGGTDNNPGAWSEQQSSNGSRYRCSTCATGDCGSDI